MRKAIVLVVLLLIPRMALPYGNGMLNLEVPAGLEARQMEFVVQHRFYGKVSEKPFDTFLGMDMGANVGIGLRYSVSEKLGFGVSYTRSRKEYTVGLRYAYFISEILRGQADVDLFSYKEPGVGGRRRGVFCQLALQGEAVLERATPVVNIGYDSYNGKVGIGLGIDLEISEDIGIMGEYFPVSDGRLDCFAFGVRLRTYGHRFMFLLGNSSEIGTRRLMLGTDSGDLYFGFNIRRLVLE